MLITADRLIAEPGGEPTRDGAVLIRDDVIVASGAARDVAVLAQPAEPHRHYPGATLLPGLVNAHVHLTMDCGDDPVGTQRSDPPGEVAARARQLLECGVTTVRDLGDRTARTVALRAEIAAGQVPGPRILAALAPLTPPRGHCWFLGGEVDGEREMLDLVRRNAEAGADVIKVMASGGHITPGGAAMWESQFSSAQLRLIVHEAANYGLPVAAHAHGTESIAAAVDAGVYTIEHCTWLSGDGVVDQRPDVAAAMATQGVAACCTTGNRDWLDMIERVGERAARQVYQRYRWLDQLGVPMIIGTDAGVRNAPFDDFAGTLEMHEWLGFPRGNVLRMATVDAARVLGLADVTGRIAPGLSADLVVVDGDPYLDLSAMRAIRLVVAAGRAHVADGER